MITNLYIKRPFLTYRSNLYMSSNKNILINPLPGATLGIPLNIIQYVLTTAHYNENILNPELITLQFCLGFFTYGYDRLLDAIEYNNTQDYVSENKKQLYNYLINNKNYISLSLLLSYLYICNQLILNDYGIEFLILLTSTVFYKNIKSEFGQFKAAYIAFFWTLSCIILPCVLHDNNLDILYDPYSYGPCFLTLFASSNLLDLKDIEEDLNNKIYTLPIAIGEKNSIIISYMAIFLSIILFFNNENYYNNLIPNTLFQLQNIGSLVVPFQLNYTIF